jgi:hypothetical protein
VLPYSSFPLEGMTEGVVFNFDALRSLPRGSLQITEKIKKQRLILKVEKFDI